MSSTSRTVSSLLRDSYDMYADRVALLRSDGTPTTYAQLRESASRLAGGLSGLGLQPGDRVMIAAKNSAEFILVDHALFWASLVRVAVSSRLHARELAQIAADCSARVIVTDAAVVEDLRRALHEVGVDATVVSTSPAGDAPTVAGLAQCEPAKPAPADPSDLAWMPYTSGTTGQPKGVMHAHTSIMACLRNLMAELPPVTDEDTLLQVAPLSHLAGWVGLLYSVRGARQVCLADFDARDALNAIAEYHVTATPVVPTIIDLLTRELEERGGDVGSLRTVIYAGSPIAQVTLGRAIQAFGDVFVQCYGLTEVPMPIACLSQADHRIAPSSQPPARLRSAGRASPFVEVRIVDEEGHGVEHGAAGEIWVRGDVVMEGYWNRPDDTIAFMKPDGWAATGDVGRLDAGYLHIVDRKKDLIVSGGFNVFPSEVETVISKIAGVRDVAVIGVPDQRWGETVVALVVREPEVELTEGDIARSCRDSIADYKQPRRIEFVDHLPKTATGKLLRRDVRARYGSNTDSPLGR